MKLEACGLRVRLGGAEVLRGVDLRVEPGEVVGIVGPNGCGKSTLMRALAGVQLPASGSVLLDGRPIRSLDRRRLARSLAFVAQHAPAPAMISVREQVMLGRFPHRRWLRESDTADAKHTDEAIDACGIGHLQSRRVEQLSGGERQRVRVAMALAQDPSVLLLDEPLAGLDIEHQHGLLEILRGLGATGKEHSVMVVLHDLELALRYFDRVVVMHEGRIRRDARPCEALCPMVFEEVFHVRGRVGQAESCGSPVVVCLGGITSGARGSNARA